jgi:hypothetical protein
VRSRGGSSSPGLSVERSFGFSEISARKMEDGGFRDGVCFMPNW